MTKRCAKAIASRNANRPFFHCNQYSNDNNWMSHYHETAAEILLQTDGKLTHFVSGIGTAARSPVLPAIEEGDSRSGDRANRARGFSGHRRAETARVSGDIIPKILDQSVVDKKVRVSSTDAARMCALLARYGVFAGQSTGAYLQACMRLRSASERNHRHAAQRYRERYMSTGSGKRKKTYLLWREQMKCRALPS